jgi:hypothetical protein
MHKLDKRPAKDYETLGRLIENTYLTGSLNRKRLMINSLVRGVFTGLGTVVGATIALAALLWLLSLFAEIPLLGPVFESLKRSVNQ